MGLVSHAEDDFDAVKSDVTQPPGIWNDYPGTIWLWSSDGNYLNHAYTDIVTGLTFIKNGAMGIYGKISTTLQMVSPAGDGSVWIIMRATNKTVHQYDDGQIMLIYYNAFNEWRLYERVSGASILRATWGGNSPASSIVEFTIEITKSNQCIVNIEGTDRLVASLVSTPDPVTQGYVAYQQYHSGIQSDWMYEYIYEDEPPPEPIPVSYPGMQSKSTILQRLMPGKPRDDFMDDDLEELTGGWDKPWDNIGWGFFAKSVRVINTGTADLLASVDGVNIKRIQPGAEYEWTRRNDKGENFLLKGTAGQSYQVFVTK